LLHVIRNGCDTESFRMPAETRRPAHSLMFVGSLVYVKGLDILLRAFARIRTQFTDATLDIYGGQTFAWDMPHPHLFPPEWLTSSGNLDWPVIQCALPGVVCRGEASREELASAYASHSLLLVPSRMDSFGLVSVEAQACGCIPVVTPAGGLRETVCDGVTGYVCSDITPDAVASRVIDLWSDDLPAEAQREAAAAWVRREFTWERAADEFVRIVESLPRRNRRVDLVLGVFHRWRSFLEAHPVLAWRGHVVRAGMRDVFQGRK
jgi:glycosyltransferase involved in cell wall biosynthesis